MTSDPHRNYAIAAAYLAGEPVARIAKRMNLSPQTVRRVAEENVSIVTMRRDRPLPAGISARAAIAVERVLGFWPAVDNAAKIRGCRMDILRAPGVKRIIMIEVDRWLNQVSPEIRNDPL